ncbi:hypothetical protein D3C87_699760 [compost metagenome]
MPLANCSLCNRLFNRSVHEACPDCREAEEIAYAQLCEYLGRHPEATLDEVVQATGVEPEQIRRMVRTGRLAGFDALAMSVLSCQRCGVPVPLGRFCAPCQRDLRQGFSLVR